MYTSLGLTTLAFIAAGSAKLAGVEQMHLSFALMGLPAWFGYFIGASELAGAVSYYGWCNIFSCSLRQCCQCNTCRYFMCFFN